MLGSRILTLITQYSAGLQQAVGFGKGDLDANVQPIYQFSEEWQVLGPFQIGTREAVWGADPLELHGGFRALEYDEKATFKSSLAFNATVHWATVQAKLSDPRQTQQASADLSIGFPDIDWRSLQVVYGWPALQWQGWARGEIFVQQGVGEISLALNVEHTLEFWVDGKHYFGGDFYGYGNAATTLHLQPGRHRIDVRLVRDMRRDGANSDPNVDIRLRMQGQGALVQAVLPESNGGYNPYTGVLISDIVGDANGPFASPYASVTLRNDAQLDAHIYDIEANHNQCEVESIEPLPSILVAGQTRPFTFRIACVPPAVGHSPLRITFKYHLGDGQLTRAVYAYALPPVRDLYAPQKVTHEHPSGIISYAVLRPPSQHAHCERGTNISAPVLLALHGAGLEADGDLVRHALDDLPDICAWTLFPTGVTPWSSDDWHTWGFADVEAAIAAIPKWIEQVGWEGPGVDVDRWVVMGHSNGGQGVWYALTHQPDKIIAAAALSAYSSIQNYVPPTFWRTADPGKVGIVQSAMNSYRHELLLENVKGIPILQQHGADDDNVPPYHSRLLSQMVEQAGAVSDYFELPGKPHWWDGAMSTDHVKHFLRWHLNTGGPALENAPVNLRKFTVVSSGQDTMTRHGVEILQLANPGQLGKVHVEFDPLTQACLISDSNMRAFRIPPWFQDCSFIEIRGQRISVSDRTGSVVVKQSDGIWADGNAMPGLPPRQGAQLGAMDAILRSRGDFVITHLSQAAQHNALQISRNLYQYFRADTKLTNRYEDAKAVNGSTLITLAIGTDLPSITDSAINVFHNRLEVVDKDLQLIHAYPTRDHLAAIWVRPRPDERLELVVWGADEEGLDIAARLVPMLSGTGQPDFIVADKTMLWKGVEGTLALGYFDAWWKVSRNAYFT
ncbi:hypothetical protein LTR10_000772 [Elasticomyces elasticus]|nr:hypothetical protein LTR10_000772 [Elasticomyces elasticus]KAK4979981.1 hypothetical protein LTR42_000288 [Elasticomyces elasticus]